MRLARLMKREAEQKRENCAERVEGGVQRGKECEMRSGDVRGLVVVDQPGEEERSDDADGDDQKG